MQSNKYHATKIILLLDIGKKRTGRKKKNQIFSKYIQMVGLQITFNI